MRRVLPLLFPFLAFSLAVVISSCCEPVSKDSQPVVIDSLYQRSYGWDLDLAASNSEPQGAPPDSGYYPIYTFGIRNSGSQDDVFTLRVRSQYNLVSGTPLGFDISRTVPAGQTVLFRTPTPIPDSITSLETITYTVQDTMPLMSHAYLGFFVPTADSTRLFIERPTLSVIYGAIDNGGEGCNTPATEKSISIFSFPDR